MIVNIVIIIDLVIKVMVVIITTIMTAILILMVENTQIVSIIYTQRFSQQYTHPVYPPLYYRLPKGGTELRSPLHGYYN